MQGKDYELVKDNLIPLDDYVSELRKFDSHNGEE
jgi:hypothetical protein